MSQLQALALIGIMALGTQLTRFLPFLLFFGSHKTPGWVTWLGQALPSAIIGFLVVYCLKDVTVIVRPYGLPELVAILFVIVLQAWKRNALISIGAGTAIYMVLVQFVVLA